AYLYNEKLKGTELVTPVEIEDVKAVYHLYVVRTKMEKRQAIQDHLKSKGISTGIHYPIALPNLKAYSYLKYNKSDFPEATKASEEILSLPMYPELSEDQVQYIAKEIKEIGLSDKS
ncbi:MAG: DegT/DnrJ/EryC1/StrS family aminotransferase, partial [Bacteroidales bacterium]